MPKTLQTFRLIYAVTLITTGLGAYSLVTRMMGADTFQGICCFAIATILAMTISKGVLPVRRSYEYSMDCTSKNMVAKVKKHTSEVCSEFLSEEEVAHLCEIAEDFATKRMPMSVFTGTSLTITDILHWGHNLKSITGHTRTGASLAKFLKQAFPSHLSGWQETTIRAKLTSDVGTYNIALLREKT